MKVVYKTRGTCSNTIELEIEGEVISNVRFSGGCDGNLQGIAKLVAGMNAQDAAERLRGIRCGRKDTSCPDQLAQAIEACLEAENRQ